jgi:hypothetical protein
MNSIGKMELLLYHYQFYQSKLNISFRTKYSGALGERMQTFLIFPNLNLN